jgi:ligand-binding sensor domain-containing protein
MKQLAFALMTCVLVACSVQSGEHSSKREPDPVSADTLHPVKTTFPQVHTNLGGRVREFVRTIHHDSRGHYWFGTNGSGLIRYDGHVLETLALPFGTAFVAVRGIAEAPNGHLWFATSEGVLRYDGADFTAFTLRDGLSDTEVWSIRATADGTVWIGTLSGICRFSDGKFTTFQLPNELVDDRDAMLSYDLAGGFLEDTQGNIWINHDGNGIFRYRDSAFIHLTAENGLTDNYSGAALLDRSGRIWLSSFHGGVSMYDGADFTHFTRDGAVKGEEVGGFCEDRNGHIWFTAEGYGVYRYDGDGFTLYTAADGLASDLVLGIFCDRNGLLWFSTWQGLSVFDGVRFADAAELVPWLGE